MENAIKKAIEGGYGRKTDFHPELLDFNDFKNWYSNDFSKILLDPVFWQCLGKGLGWKSSHSWLERWHEFIDHLANGKDADSFFKDLLTI